MMNQVYPGVKGDDAVMPAPDMQDYLTIPVTHMSSANKMQATVEKGQTEKKNTLKPVKITITKKASSTRAAQADDDADIYVVK